MLSTVRSFLVAQVAAVLVAVALTGAPRLLAVSAPSERHRCLCKDHGEDQECDCARCRSAALRAQAGDERAPPCHRVAARKALSERAGSSPELPGIEGACGGDPELATTAAAAEPFPSPSTSAIPLEVRSEPLTNEPGSATSRLREPETPPPRFA